MGTTIFELNDFYRRRIELMLKLEILREDELGISEKILEQNERLINMLGPDFQDETGTLCIRKKRNGYRFFNREPAKNGKPVDTYLSEGSDIFRRLAVKSIIEKLQADIRNEVEYMNRRLNIINRHYARIEKSRLTTVVARLGKSAPGFEVDFLTAIMQFSSPKQIARMHEVMSYCRSHSEQNPNYKNERNKETKAGYWVRSKDEKDIADTLYEENIPFCYEPLIVLDGIEFHPDFMLIRPDGSVVIWEHRGIDKASYIEDGYKRLKIYNKHGFYMNNNLVYTYPHDLRRKATLLKIIMRFYYVW